MNRALLVCALLLLSVRAHAQTTAPAATPIADSVVLTEIPFDVTACHTEYVGPAQIKSGNWALVDTIIAKLGGEHALAYFKQHLHDNTSASFYALIGIHRLGAIGEYEQALFAVENEEILFQKGCLMMKKPLREAVTLAINDRH